MRESLDEHNAEEPKSPTKKKIKLSRYFSNLGRYYRIFVEDFLIAICIIILFSLMLGLIYLLSIVPSFHLLKEKLTYFEKAHFWLSFVTFLMFLGFSIFEIIVAKSKELKDHDDS